MIIELCPRDMGFKVTHSYYPMILLWAHLPLPVIMNSDSFQIQFHQLYGLVFSHHIENPPSAILNITM